MSSRVLGSPYPSLLAVGLFEYPGVPPAMWDARVRFLAIAYALFEGVLVAVDLVGSQESTIGKPYPFDTRLGIVQTFAGYHRVRN